MTINDTLACPPDKNYTHPAIEDRFILAAENAIRLAWIRLQKKKSMNHVLTHGKEIEVTNKLQKELDHIRNNGTSPGYNDKTFERPHRGNDLCNYDETHIEKQPDLIFYISGTREEAIDSLHDGIFVECKVLDNGSRNIGLYATKGIHRFLTGDYAWRMPHALMLGYVRTNQKLPDDLTSYFDKRGNKTKFCLITGIKRCTKTRKKPAVYVSSHCRKWQHTDSVKPGDIAIRHLWLDVY